MQSTKSELVELLGRNDLLRASLILGQIQDSAFSDHKYVETVMGLAARAWRLCDNGNSDATVKAEMINQVLFEEFGVEGKTEKYKQVIDDPHRYYLHSVLERKTTSPLSLAILYMVMAEQMGLQVQCLALPSYYLVRVLDGTTEFFIDPFEHGKFLTPEEFQKKFRSALQKSRMISANLFERVNAQQLVARMVQQLKHIYILKGNAVEALRSVELLTALFPESPELTRDRGILYCEMEYFSKAMTDLKFYLEHRPSAEDVGEIKKLANMLRGYREIVN